MSTQLASRVSGSTNSVTPCSSRKNSAAIASDNARLSKLMKSYQTDQQVKYLHLEAEIEVLLQQLQSLQRQRQLQDSSNVDGYTKLPTN